LIEIISNIQYAHKAGQWLFTRQHALAVAFLLTGCSVSVPLGGLVDMTPTGSLRKQPQQADARLEPGKESLDMVSLGSLAVKPKQPDLTENLLSASIDPEDMFAARSALDAALNAKNGLRTVVWTNPETGAGGSFTSLDSKTAAGCKKFASSLRFLDGTATQTAQGMACLDNRGLWTIQNLAPIV
jgi:surface antigen